MVVVFVASSSRGMRCRRRHGDVVVVIVLAVTPSSFLLLRFLFLHPLVSHWAEDGREGGRRGALLCRRGRIDRNV